tara:strand:+ start:967 stop:2496 length:1530 start_codon:yes stop_codon:yes gene_type:complete
VNINKISYKSTGIFSKFIEDFSENNTPDFMGKLSFDINDVIPKIKSKNNQSIDRELLNKVINSQYRGLDVNINVVENINLIKDTNTFTITTGHQLCLFTGPLYFIYKIISIINLSEYLNKSFPEYNFIPLFWLASEDHDFDEINHIHLFGDKYEWFTKQSGCVGDFDVSEIKNVIQQLYERIGFNEDAKGLLDLFGEAYQKKNLTDSTRYIINTLFGKYGVVCIDPNDNKLKEKILPVFCKDINKELSPIIKDYSNKISKYYKLQANVRDINFFKIGNGCRDRILDLQDFEYLKRNPQYISPNVLMRPLFQEIILPNIAYIGGGSEIAYWSQLQTLFKNLNVDFPILILRNSVVLVEDKDLQFWKKNNLRTIDFFNNLDRINSNFIQNKEELDIDKYIDKIKIIYSDMVKNINSSSLSQSLNSEFFKQEKVLKKIEKQKIKENKQKYLSTLRKIEKIKNKIFPDNILQERRYNIIYLYIIYGSNIIEMLKEEINPLDSKLLILSPKNRL